MRKYIIGLIIFLALVCAVSIFAWWVVSINSPAAESDDLVVKVGRGEEVDTVIQLANTADDVLIAPFNLVKAGLITSGASSYAEFVIQVNWLEDHDVTTLERLATGATGLLNVSVVIAVECSEEVDVTTEIGALVNYQLAVGPTVVEPEALSEFTSSALTDVPIILEGTAIVLILRVALTQPANLEQFLCLAEATITLTLTFNVVVDDLDLHTH
jgi:hypothetical protein